MTHERSDRIRLPYDIARCEPATPGFAAHRCARYMAAIPPHGGVMEDFTARSGAAGCSALCSGYKDLAGLHRDAYVASQPRKFPPIGGGS